MQLTNMLEVFFEFCVSEHRLCSRTNPTAMTKFARLGTQPILPCPAAAMLKVASERHIPANLEYADHVPVSVQCVHICTAWGWGMRIERMQGLRSVLSQRIVSISKTAGLS